MRKNFFKQFTIYLERLKDAQINMINNFSCLRSNSGARDKDLSMLLIDGVILGEKTNLWRRGKEDWKTEKPSKAVVSGKAWS